MTPKPLCTAGEPACEHAPASAAGRWPLAVGDWLFPLLARWVTLLVTPKPTCALAAGGWLLAIGYWLFRLFTRWVALLVTPKAPCALAVGGWLLAIGYWLFWPATRRAAFPVVVLAALCVAAPIPALAQTSLTNLPPALQDVIRLTRAGMTEEVILAEVKSAGVTYKLSSDQLVCLSNEGVSQNVIQALMRKEEAAPSAPPKPAGIPPTGAPPAWARASLPPDLNHLHELLAPYGKWLDVAPYGECWRPSAATADPNWRPYAQQGHWVYTDAGWFWHSDYSWGHVTFHFGRWLREQGSWVWVPGRDWAPAWVCWREADGYLGWAPLPPAVVFKSGAGLQFEGAPARDSAFGLGPEAFTFIPCDHFWDRDLAAAIVPPDRAAEVFAHSVVRNGYGSVNGVFAVEGPGRERVAALTHRSVNAETPAAPPGS